MKRLFLIESDSSFSSVWLFEASECKETAKIIKGQKLGQYLYEEGRRKMFGAIEAGILTADKIENAKPIRLTDREISDGVQASIMNVTQQNG